ncbi:hypothetical protein E0Z10_g1017 [Xylaria hypoxylon]|uniref:Vacuolar ATPase assembly protein VMA22 n=1 Tax=Xylaria hypoxylon TaxID=37992 RepID=A0A4Z0Z833_9PEZI|nr:hypothetical protein E0Z10_g1017 [Xylaria hypoxylon]
MDQDHIDGLLERYLHLLHDYTSLREELAALQTGMYQSIARANFAAERGVRFGQDYYDDRMQASRRLAISCKSQDQDHAQAQAQVQDLSESQNEKNLAVLSGMITSFAVVNPAAVCVPASTVEDSEAGVEAPNPNPNHNPHPRSEAEAEDESVEQTASKSTNIEAPRAQTPSPQTDIDAQPGRSTRATVGECTDSSPSMAKKGTATPQKSNDPLRWFGILSPMPLREAQIHSIRAVEHVIPRLASLDIEMEAVEIEVRRARKRLAKAEAAASKLPQQSG